jgi:hypothetical protein
MKSDYEFATIIDDSYSDEEYIMPKTTNIYKHLSLKFPFLAPGKNSGFFFIFDENNYINIFLQKIVR